MTEHEYTITMLAPDDPGLRSYYIECSCGWWDDSFSKFLAKMHWRAHMMALTSE